MEPAWPRTKRGGMPRLLNVYPVAVGNMRPRDAQASRGRIEHNSLATPAIQTLD